MNNNVFQHVAESLNFMRCDFAVLGATGMQGRIVARDLLERGFSVLLCGRDRSRVERLLKRFGRAKFAYFDARDIAQTAKVIARAKSSVVVNCVEGDWNVHILKACMVAGASCVDLGSDIEMTKEQLGLHSELRRRGVVSITGCGSVPGVGNVMLRYAVPKFDRIDSVGVGFNWDSNIKEFVVPFSIQSIIEEFTSPAPVIRNGRVRRVSPMETLVMASHRGVGRGYQFNVGHHPEPYTFYDFCRKKGVRNVEFFAGFPEHSFRAIQSMIDFGWGDKVPVMIGGVKVRPVDVLTETLKRIGMPKGYTEKENLWVTLVGKQGGRKKEMLMECIVPTLKGWEDAGCNVDTGIPASIIAQYVRDGVIEQKGSFAPEQVVPPEKFFVDLKRRQMRVYENGKLIN